MAGREGERDEDSQNVCRFINFFTSLTILILSYTYIAAISVSIAL